MFELFYMIFLKVRNSQRTNVSKHAIPLEKKLRFAHFRSGIRASLLTNCSSLILINKSANSLEVQ